MMPAIRAVPSTSPFLALPDTISSSVALLMTTRPSATAVRSVAGFRRHVDHARFALGVDMGEGRACLWKVCAPFSARPVAPTPSLRASSARVAAVTSACRIRLSPTRKVDMPTRASRARSAGVKMPLSPTIRRSLGISGASASLVASVVSKVRRLRLLTPIIGERSLRARSSSARSWISISTSMPWASAASSMSRAARVVERGHDDQDAVGAMGARLRPPDRCRT